MSLCGLMCRVRCRDVLLCYDSSASSDVQCAILCYTCWSCRWLPAASRLRQRNTRSRPIASQLRRLQSVLNAAARLIGLHRSSRHEHVTLMLRDLQWSFCGLWNASISSWLCSFTDACMVSLTTITFQPPLSPVVVILTAGDPTYTRLSTVGDRAFPVAGSRL